MRTLTKILNLVSILNAVSKVDKVYVAFKGDIPAAIVVIPFNHNLVQTFSGSTLLYTKRQPAENPRTWFTIKMQRRKEIFSEILGINPDLVVENLDCFILNSNWETNDWIDSLLRGAANLSYEVVDYTDQ